MIHHITHIKIFYEYSYNKKIDKKRSTHALEVSSGEVPALDSEIAEKPLLIGFLEYVLLDGLLADEPVYVNVPGLSDPVTPILRLCVHRRIPVAVVEYNGVGASEIDADSTRSRR